MGIIVVTQQVQADSSLSLGAEYREGDYGTGESTASWYLPLGWSYYGERFSTSLTLPFVYVEGASTVSATGRPLGRRGGGAATTTRSDSGLGDIQASGSYQFMREADSGVLVDATAKAKLGTADESRGLGSGENDYSLQLGLGTGVIYGYGGYKWVGDSATVDYNDVAFGGLSLTLPVAETAGLGLSYYAEESLLSGSDDIHELTLSLNGELSRDVSIGLYLGSGLTDSSADTIMGINLTAYIE